MEILPTSEEALGQGFQSTNLPHTNTDGLIPTDLVEFLKETGAVMAGRGLNTVTRRGFQAGILAGLADAREETKLKQLPKVFDTALKKIGECDPWGNFSYIRDKRRPYRNRVLAAKARAGIAKTSPGFYNDVRELTNLALEIADEGRIDSLTGLPNRRGLEDELNLLRALTARGKLDPKRLSVVSADIDNLKQCNDTHGHLAGDELVRTAGRLLKESGRRLDLVARTGGDEFIMLLTDCDEPGAKRWLRRFRKLMAGTFLLDGSHVGVSAGIARLHLDNFRDSLEKADKRLYADKRKRKARHPVSDGLVAPAVRM